MTVLPFLKSLETEPVRKKLQIVLKGPEVPSDENGSSNHARNTMVELNLAARLHRAGLVVKIGEEADLVFDHGAVRWFGECKRPFKVESIENNLKDACSQLGRRLAGYRLAGKGLLAVSLSRPISTRAPILEFTDAQELRRSLRQHLGEMVTLIRDRMSEFSQCSIGGLDFLVAHLVLAAWNSREALPTGIQHTMLADLSRDGREEAKRLWTVLEPTFDG